MSDETARLLELVKETGDFHTWDEAFRVVATEYVRRRPRLAEEIELREGGSL